MKQTVFLLIHVFFFLQWESACAQSYEWAYRWVNSTQGTGVSTDNQGNIYLISYGNTQTNFNPTNSPGILGVTFGCASVSKLSPMGNLIWIKFISQTGATSGGCTPTQIIVKNGFIYVTGTFGGGGGLFDFDPNSGIANSNGLNPTLKGFLLKWDLDGNYVWHKLQTTPVGLTIEDLHVDAQGSCYLCGSFANSITANTQSLFSNGSSDAFFIKYDSNGNLNFLQGFGGNQSQPDVCNGISTDSNGNIFVGGVYNGTVDFDPSFNSTLSTSNGSGDAFVAKFNSNAGFMWVKAFGVNGSNDEVNDIIVDNSNNIYFTGTAVNSIDFDFGNATQILNSANNYSFIVKWDNSGNYIWANAIYSTSSCQGKRLEVNNNEVVVVGIGSGLIDVDPTFLTLNVSSIGIFNTVISRFNLNGSFIYGGIINNNDSNYNRPNGIALTNNSILVAGDFKGSIDINPDQNASQTLNSLTNSAGTPNSSNFILKLGICNSSFSTQNITTCSSYTWPINNQTYTTSGIFTDTLLNVAGCDSIVTLSLTINTPVSNNISASSCDSYNWNGNIYTSTGVYTQQLATTNGCDSTVTLNLTITNSPSAIVSSPDGIILNANLVPNATYQWIYCSDLTPISNETQSQFIPQINGLYAVVITNNCGSDTSECATVNTIGFSELNPSTFQVFPNPSNGLYTITQGLSTEPTEMYLSDVHGRILMRQWINKSSFSIDIQKYKPGTYFIHFGDFGVVQIMKE